jgi:transcriptional regulator with XRE-family HTH domain
MTTADALKAYRSSLGLSQSGLAKLAGVSIRMVQDIEQGKRRADDGLLRLALIAGCK